VAIVPCCQQVCITASRCEETSSDGGRSLEARVMELERMLDKVGKRFKYVDELKFSKVTIKILRNNVI